MFGFRKSNAILSSLPMASKKRKSMEETKGVHIKKPSDDPSHEGNGDTQVSKPIPIHPIREEIFSTPIAARTCAAMPEEYSTPFVANKNIPLDAPLCMEQETIKGLGAVDFLPNTNVELELLVKSSPNLGFVDVVSSASITPFGSGNELLDSYSSEFLQINLKIKKIIAQLYDALDLLVQKISDQVSMLQETYMGELSHKVTMTHALKCKTGTTSGSLFSAEDLEVSLNALFTMVKDVYSKMKS